MSRITRKLRDGILTLGTAGVLGFGAVQVFATPARAEAAAACNQQACNSACEAQHGPFASGWCDENGQCQCAV